MTLSPNTLIDLLVIQNHSRNAAEFIAALAHVEASIPNASPLSGVGRDGKPTASQRDQLEAHAKQLRAMVGAHMSNLNVACQRFLGVVIEDDAEPKADKPLAIASV